MRSRPRCRKTLILALVAIANVSVAFRTAGHVAGGQSNLQVDHVGDHTTRQSTIAKQPSKRPLFWRLSKVLLPLCGIVLIIGSFLAMRSTASKGDDAKVERQRLSEKSYIHPLVAQTGKSTIARTLNQRRHFTEQIEKTFTKSRLITLCVALSISLIVACALPIEKFAIPTRTYAMSKDECKLICGQRDGLNCEDAKKGAKFRIRWCTPKGECVNSRAEVEDTLLYHQSPECIFKIEPANWKIDFVLVSLIFSISLIVEGVSSELVLIGVSCLFACFGIISGGQAFSGLSNTGVVGLALLFPLAASIEETGVLDSAVSVLLGNSSNLTVALFRMMVPVAILSAFLSNTAIVTMMIPIIVSWAKRIGISPGKMLMPLTYVAQLGGTTTLIGSSICLVAKNAVKGYEMGFFDLAVPGFTICFVSCFFIVLCLPMLSSSNAPESEEVSEDPSSGGRDVFTTNAFKNYEVGLVVGASSIFVGAATDESTNQLRRNDGVESVTLESNVVELGSILRCRCTARGVVALRNTKGLLLTNDDSLKKLGAYRRERSLYEAAVRPESCLVGLPLDVDAMREALGCCPVAIRGKASFDSSIEEGDVLLVEAEDRFVHMEDWAQEFLLTTKIPHSSPPRIGGPRDALRGAFVCIGMAILIGLVTADVVSLAAGAGVFLLVLVLIRARSVSQVYESVNAPVLLTIAGAFGLSEALQATGVAGFAADSITEIAPLAGVNGLRCALYVLAMFLSMFMNNSATVAIIGPLLDKVAKETNQSLPGLLFVVVFGAGACFTTPLGYQTNMMVMKDGGYTFGDFLKFGAPVQAMHCITSLVVVYVCIDKFELLGKP